MFEMEKIIQDAIKSEGIDEEEYYVAVLEGARNKTIKSFLDEIGKAFKFPSYYGKNLSALNECLNDLEWIDKPNYILFIEDYEKFLSKESKDDKVHILGLLNEASRQWANVPNYEGEDEYRKKADFRVRLLESK